MLGRISAYFFILTLALTLGNHGFLLAPGFISLPFTVVIS